MTAPAQTTDQLTKRKQQSERPAHMKNLLELHTKTHTAHEAVKARIKARYPMLQEVTIYGHRNLALTSEHFSIDMYADSTPKDRTSPNYKPSYNESNIKMNCKMEMSEIPTEDQAIAQVRMMHLERAEFIEVMEWVRDTILNDEAPLRTISYNGSTYSIRA